MSDVDWIHIRNFSFPCIVGLFTSELMQEQTLEIEIGVGLDLDQAASGELGASVNYASTAEQVQFIAQEGRFRLLESMAAAILSHLLSPPGPGEARKQVERAFVRLRKPEVLPSRAVPSVELTRPRAWAERRGLVELSKNVGLRELQVARGTGAYHLELRAGAEWAAPLGAAVHVISGEVEVRGERVGPGKALARAAQSIVNRAPSGSRLLVTSQPAL